MHRAMQSIAVALVFLICGCTSRLDTSPLQRPGDGGTSGEGSGGAGGAGYGTLTGTVVSSIGLLPIADASVTVGQTTTFTNVSGAFTIADVLAGNELILIQADDYDELLDSVTVVAGQNNLGQFALTPAAHLKTIVIMDQSNSLNTTDAALARIDALGDLLAAHMADATRLKTGYEMALVGFWGSAQVYTTDAAGNPGFTTDIAELNTGIAALATTNSNTGYDRALAAVFDLIDAHSVTMGSIEKARARYELLLVSDGMPFPDNCPGEANSPDAILQQVGYITDLATARGVSLRLHTTGLVHTALFDTASISCVGQTESHTLGWELTTLLSDMAITGGGIFRYATAASQLFFDQPFIDPEATSANPVKIMFIVDNSGSMQFNDPSRRLAATIQGTMAELRGTYPGAEYAGIVMTADSQPLIDFDACEVFSQSPPDIAAEMLFGDMSMTDIQGALNVTKALLEKDMQRVARRDVCPGGSFPAADELERSRYVVVLISDGLPDPQCQAGPCNDVAAGFPPDPSCGGATINMICEDQDYVNCLTKENDGVAPDVSCSGGFCNYNGTSCVDQQSAGNGLFGSFPGLATELTGGGNYNQPWQLEARAAQIVELAAAYGVAEVIVHSVLVHGETELPEALRLVFGDNGPALMEGVAAAADGVYMERSPNRLLLGELDFSPLP